MLNTHTHARTHAVARANISLSACAAGTVQSQYCAAGTDSHSTVPLVQYRQSQYCAAGTVQTVTVLCRWYRQSQYCASQCTALACPTAAVCTGAVHAYWLIRFSRTLVKHLGATRVAFVQTVRSWCTSFCSPQLNY